MSWTLTRVNSTGSNFHYLGCEESVTGELIGLSKNFTCQYKDGSFTFRDASGASLTMSKSEIANINGTDITTQTDSEIFDLILAVYP